MRMRLTIATLLTCLLTVPPAWTRAMQDRGQTVRAGVQWPGKAKRYALLVGVNSYDDPQITPLAGPSNDVRSLEDSLVQYGGFDRDRIVRLSTDQPDANRKPTRGNILRSLSNVLKAVPSDGLLVLAFSCHGVERDGRAFLLPSDAQVNYDISLLENTSLEVATIKKMIRDKQDPKTKAAGVAQVVALLDACRNDPTSGKDLSINPLTAAYNFDLRNTGVRAFVTLYATSLGHRAYENRSTSLGYFIGEVVAALKGAAVNERGEVTLESLLQYVEDKVPNKVTLDLGRDQQPYAVIEGYRASDLVLAVHNVPPPPAPVPAPVVSAPAPIAAPAARMSVAGMALSALSPFTTVTVDANGKITGRRANQESWGHVEDLGNGVKLEMVEVPSGEFLMGEDAAGAADYEKECVRYLSKELCAPWGKMQTPQRRVKLNGFLMGKYEVTQGQWKAVMGALPPNLSSLSTDFKGDDLPVVNVSWEEAQEFIKKLNEKLKLGRSAYRMPSEVEWEYAARAGTRTPFAFGETISPETANYWWDNPHRNAQKKDHLGHPVKVGSYPANAFGLFDLHGNVWEWCEDDWHDSYNGAPVDGRAWVDTPSRGSSRVDRGGGWYAGAVSCRSADRSHGAPGIRSATSVSAF
ncbi:MAG: SUMF1/EgtB/PvdO family nonheme iron enzyme [Burkholderiales bacterium]